MNTSKLNYHNFKYHFRFNNSISESYNQGFSDYNFLKDTNYEMKPKPLTQPELENINALKLIGYANLPNNLPLRGLCTIMTDILIEELQGILERENAYITIGKIHCNKKGNIFNVPSKKHFLNKLKEQAINNEALEFGGNVHAWITLSDGTIIDPTIDITLNNDNILTFDSKQIICGSSKEIYDNNGYTYIPYIVTKYTVANINRYKKLGKIQKLEYASSRIISNIEHLNNRREEAKNFLVHNNL